MSKSLSHILVPALGGTALVIAGAVVFANKEYGQTKIKRLEDRVVAISTLTSNERANQSTQRADALSIQVEEIKAEAAERAANMAVFQNLRPNGRALFGLGRKAHQTEIKAWDIDVLPDGRGLPEGSGDALTGEEVFAENCASCHGDFAEGVDNWPVLAGGFDTLADKDPVKTVGSYWPYLLPFGIISTALCHLEMHNL